MRHGARVRVEYVDLGEPDAREEHAAVLRRIEEQGLPYPLVAVNGTLRLAGSAHYSHLLPLVEEALGTQPASQPAGSTPCCST
jgi:disulfide oxidoreductase YuzD